MSHGAGRSIHNLFPNLWIDNSHSNDPPKEPLMRIGRFLSPQSLQFFVVKKGLHPQVVVHPQGLELLGQGKVCEDHIMDLNRNKLVFNQNEDRFVMTTCCPDRQSPPDLLGGGLVMVFKPLADWKVWLCQEIGLVAIMFFFELLFFICCS